MLPVQIFFDLRFQKMHAYTFDVPDCPDFSNVDSMDIDEGYFGQYQASMNIELARDSLFDWILENHVINFFSASPYLMCRENHHLRSVFFQII